MSAATDPWLDLRTAPLPRVLWIELTSRCPFDCIFCTRASLRGAGQHLGIALYRQLLQSLDRPQLLRLNYAGESGHYPHLTEAVALAAATGAQVELVSALASLKPERLQAALEAGLNRLTVSLHTLQADRFEQIYRFASLDGLLVRLQQVLDWRERAAHPFTLDLAFVAMERNLDELPQLAEFAQAHGIEVLAVHPLIGRDPLPMGSSTEHLADGAIAPNFAKRLRAAVQTAQQQAPAVSVQLSSHELQPATDLGPHAQPWPWPLPAQARIAGCDQSPFDTVHILADGRVVVCEVTEQTALGNLHQNGLQEIWQGEAYRQFRARHLAGSEPACQRCVYKQAYRPGLPQHRLLPQQLSPQQLLHGWYPLDDCGALWSTDSAALWLPRPFWGRQLRLRGQLAQPGRADARFRVRINEAIVHEQPWPAAEAVDLRLRLPDRPPRLLLQVECDGASSANQQGTGADVRTLGFALHGVEAGW